MGSVSAEFPIDHSRAYYATPRTEVEELLLESLNFVVPIIEENHKPIIKKENSVIYKKPEYKISEPMPSEITKETKPVQEEKEVSTHRYLQTLVKKMAEARGYTAILETQLPNGSGQVDVLLSKENKAIAVEICVTTDPDWEMHNIEKCLVADYDTVISLCGDLKQLERIRKKCIDGIPGFEKKQVQFFTPDALFSFLDNSVKDEEPQEQIIKGYRVNVTYDSVTQEEMDRKRASVAKVVMDSLRKIKKKE